MGALLSLIPPRDFLYGAAIVGLIVFGFYEKQHLINEGAAEKVAELKTSSDKLEAKAAAQVKQIATAYAASVHSTEDTLNAQLQAANVQHDSDSQRLREYDAYRRQHPALPSPASGSGTQAAGNGGSNGYDGQLASLEQVALGLATAGRQVNAALTACMADRDALTGK